MARESAMGHPRIAFGFDVLSKVTTGRAVGCYMLEARQRMMMVVPKEVFEVGQGIYLDLKRAFGIGRARGRL